MKDLTGKTAVVTGAASGIGLAMAEAFVAEGMNVVLADIEADALGKALGGFDAEAKIESVLCDVADPDQVENVRDVALDKFGAVHVVCNNAGVSTGGPIWEHSLDDWQWMLGVNLYGVVNGIRTFTPLMIEQGEGHIVNTASMAGLVSGPMMGIYNVTKHSVVTLTETLSADLQMSGAEGVHASVLCPGWVDTRIHQAGRNRPDAPNSEPNEQEAAMQSFIGNLLASGLKPAVVGEMVVDAIQQERFYILTHPEWSPMITARTERIVAGENPSAVGLPT